MIPAAAVLEPGARAAFARRANREALVLVLTLASGLFLSREALASNVIGSFESEIQRLCDDLRGTVVCVEARQVGSAPLVGAGVIADAEGIVVTTASVVGGANEVRVRIADRGDLPAKVIGTDPITNLAVLQVEGDGLTAARFAASAEATPPGSWVMILGNSYGAGPTVSVGILAGRRPCSAVGEGEGGLLQVNAPVNPGDSGGALINSRGEVIGIVCAALTPRENPEGSLLVGGPGEGRAWGSGATVGFAVPMGMGRIVIDEIRTKGRVVRGFLGLAVQALPPEKAAGFVQGERASVIVTNVLAGGPAERAGFLVGDMILAIDGKPIGTPRRLQRLVETTMPSASLVASIVREGAAKKITATVEEMPLAFAEKHRAPKAQRAASAIAGSGEANAKLLGRIDALEAELRDLRTMLGTAQAPAAPPER